MDDVHALTRETWPCVTGTVAMCVIPRANMTVCHKRMIMRYFPKTLQGHTLQTHRCTPYLETEHGHVSQGHSYVLQCTIVHPILNINMLMRLKCMLVHLCKLDF